MNSYKNNRSAIRSIASGNRIGLLAFVPAAGFALLLSAAVTSGAELVTSWASPFVQAQNLEQSAYKDVPVRNSSVPLVWGDLDPNGFGPKKITYDTSGMRQLPKLPPVGVHPRVLFTREQLPDIRRRLKETRVGQHMWKAVIAWTEELKGQYDLSAYYTQPDTYKGHFKTHGFIDRFRASCLRDGEAYEKYCTGDTDFSGFKNLGIEWGIFPLEALRCLIEEDEGAGRKLGVAIETAIKAYNQDSKKGTDESPWGKWGIQGFNVAYTYDLAYEWLSPEARDLLRENIVEQSCYSDHYGSFTIPQRSFSNWSTFTYPLVGLLAIEGEEGFNDLKYLGMLRSWRNFFTYGWYQSGACAEGMGKNQLGGDALAMFSLRGENIAGHPHALTYIRERVPREVLPGDDRYLHFDRWGGIKRINTLDAMSMKYLYPNDTATDWVYRKSIGWDDEYLSLGAGTLLLYWNSVLIEAVLADDPLPEAQQASQEQVTEGAKTFFCGERNLMSTRSDWGDDALFLNFQARPFNGGHVFADRNAFHLAGASAYWFIKRPIAYQTDQNNLVQVDGQLQSPQAPARIVDYVDNELATFVVGDSKYGWDWEVVDYNKWQKSMGVKISRYTRLPRGGDWEPVWETSNDFSWNDTPAPYLNKPIYERNHWQASDVDEWEMMARRPNFPVACSFRTAGLVRGVKPEQSYSLVMDDMRVDDGVHRYEWLGQLDETTKIWKIEESHPSQQYPHAAFTRDIYLFQPENAQQTAPVEGQPVLLVRVLDMSLARGKEFSDFVELREVTVDKKIQRRLVLTAEGVSPNFKLLLFPYRLGEIEPPMTHWKGSVLEVLFPSEKVPDRLGFARGDSGKLNLQIRRGGVELVTLDRAVKPTPDRTPSVAAKDVNLPDPLQKWTFDSDAGLSFVTGKYSTQNAKLVEGALFFDEKGHQQVNLPDVAMASTENLTISLRIKTDKIGPCLVIQGKAWSFSLAYWNETKLSVPGGVSTVRHTEEEIQSWFIENWANVVIVKAGRNWSLYLNGKLLQFETAKESLSGEPFTMQLGGTEFPPSYGMLGKVDEVALYDTALTHEQIQAMLPQPVTK